MIKFIARRINKRNSKTCIYCGEVIRPNQYSTLHLRNNLIYKVCNESLESKKH